MVQKIDRLVNRVTLGYLIIMAVMLVILFPLGIVMIILGMVTILPAYGIWKLNLKPKYQAYQDVHKIATK